jgi:hypothetical protein
MLALVVFATVAVIARAPTGARPGSHPPGVASALAPHLPVIATHSYTMSGRVRLLLVWVGRSRIGGARVNWREQDGVGRGLEVLIGTDPARAPFHLNKWGYVFEEDGPEESRLVGLMTEADAASVAEARAAASRTGGDVYKAIVSTIRLGEERSGVRVLAVDKPFTYRDLDDLVQVLGAAPARERSRPVPGGADLGMLAALRMLIRADAADAVAAHRDRKGGPSRAFVYNTRLFDMSTRRSRAETDLRLGGRSFPDARALDIEIRNQTTGETSGFSVTYAVLDGREVPLRMTYRPKWWLEIEIQLDDDHPF